MIRWLLFAAVVFLVPAALQGVMASRHAKKPVEGQDRGLVRWGCGRDRENHADA